MNPFFQSMVANGMAESPEPEATSLGQPPNP